MCVINAHEWIRGHEQVQYLEQNRECCWSSRSVFIDDDYDDVNLAEHWILVEMQPLILNHALVKWSNPTT